MNFWVIKSAFSTPINTALRLSAWALSTTLLWAGSTYAQVNLSPMTIEVEANRNQAQGVINITNSSNETFRARVYAEAFTYHRDSGFQILPSSPTDLRPYLQFSPRELIVPPGTTRKVRLNARLSPSLAHGEYRAMIFTEPLRQNTITDGNGNTTRIITRVGAALFVRKGNALPNFAVESASWNSNAKQIQLLIRNTGNASAYPFVRWTLKQGSAIVATGETPATGIVPESDRNLILNQSKKKELVLTPGNYQLSGELLWGENKNRKLPFKLDLAVPPKATK